MCLHRISSVPRKRWIAGISTSEFLQSSLGISPNFQVIFFPRSNEILSLTFPLLESGVIVRPPERITLGAPAVMFALYASDSCRNMNGTWGAGENRPNAWHSYLKSGICTFLIAHAKA